jgi:hypothetical protein
MANSTTPNVNPFDQSHQSPSITFICEDCHLFAQAAIRYADVGFCSKLNNLSQVCILSQSFNLEIEPEINYRCIPYDRRMTFITVTER